MINKYGRAAIKATQLFQSNPLDILQCWNRAVIELFPHQKASQEKGCPKTAYLGLCEEGLVKGVPAGNYTRGTLNKEYAVNAIKVLKSKNIDFTSEELWQAVMQGNKKTENGQMDVVLALWDEGLIK